MIVVCVRLDEARRKLVSDAGRARVGSLWQVGEQGGLAMPSQLQGMLINVLQGELR